MGNAVWPLWTAWIPVASFLLMIAGFWFRRARRKVDDHPVCGKCGFDLFGAPSDSLRCAECGNRLALRGAIRTGNYVASPRRRLTALAIIFIGLTATAFLGREVYKRVDLQPLKPDWWLAFELDSKDRQRRGAAISTLFDRAVAGSLNETISLKLEDVILEAMPRFAVMPGQIHWLNQRILGDPKASAERLEKLARAHLGNRVFSVRSKVAAGDSLPVGLVVGASYRAWPTSNAAKAGEAVIRNPVILANGVDAVRAQIDGTGEFNTLSGTIIGGGTDLSSRTAFKWVLPTQQLDSLKPGEHSIDLEAEFEVRVEMRTDEERNQYQPELDPNHVRTIARVTLKETCKFTLLPEGEPSSRLVADESVRAKVMNGIRLEPFPKEAPTNCMLSLGSIPVGVAFEVFFCQGGREVRGATVSSPPRRGMGTAISYPDDATPGPAELVFKPNLKIATNSVEVFDVWDGELRFPIIVPTPPATAPSP